MILLWWRLDLTGVMLVRVSTGELVITENRVNLSVIFLRDSQMELSGTPPSVPSSRETVAPIPRTKGDPHEPR
jgi:hypothetical protein